MIIMIIFLWATCLQTPLRPQGESRDHHDLSCFPPVLSTPDIEDDDDNDGDVDDADAEDDGGTDDDDDEPLVKHTPLSPSTSLDNSQRSAEWELV